LSLSPEMSSLHKIQAGKWTWIFLQKPEKKDYFTAPDLLMQGAVVLKDMPDVKVFHRDDLFFKWEIAQNGKFSFDSIRRILFPRNKKEFFTLCSLQKDHFPVTEPVGYAYCGNQSVLITGKAGGVSVMSYLCDIYEQGSVVPKEFLQAWGAFLNRFILSGYYFPDFHCGNLLYDPEKKSFSLVDVYGVRKVFFRETQRQYRMFFRQLKDAMPFLDRSDLQLVLQTSGIVYGENNFTDFLGYSAGAVQEFLPRRLKNWKKSPFCLRPDGKKWNFRHTETTEIAPESVEKVRKHDILCQLFGIPRIHLAEIQENGTVVHEEICGEADDSSRVYLLSRLALAGLETDAFAVVLNHAKMPVVVDRRLLKENQSSRVNS